MSRIGKKPIGLPSGVNVKLDQGQVTAKGPKGTLSITIDPCMTVEVNGPMVKVIRPTESRKHRSIHGLTRSLIQNIVTGVSDGFQKTLEIQGVGYRVNLEGKTATFNLGFSHPVKYSVPEDVSIEVKDQKIIAVRGIDKQRVGQVAAIIRGFKPPEPYKGTGIKYQDEKILRKEGKAGAK